MKKKLSNLQIEDEAIKYVQKCEPKLKRAEKGSGYDLYCNNKIVEVKATRTNKEKQQICFSSKKEYNAWDKNKKKYFLYRVINVGSSKINIIKYTADNLELITEPRWRVRIIKSKK